MLAENMVRDRREHQHLRDYIESLSKAEYYQQMFICPLTGLLNRRAYELAPESIYVTIVDIDSLHNFNETYGHAAGDKLIQRVASALSHAFNDSVYVWGGDEFVIKSNHLLAVPNSVKGLVTYGVGSTFSDADADLFRQKEIRVQQGKRVVYR